MERILKVKYQREYHEADEWDEYEMAHGRQVWRDQTHEILHGSRKTFERWNMIRLTVENHDRAHRGGLTMRELFMAKGVLGNDRPPDDVIREFDLQEVWP